MNNNGMTLSRNDRLALIVLAVVQSLLLLLLHKSLIHEVWPATNPRWLLALYTPVIWLPLFFYLGAARWNDRANAYAAPLLGAVLFWLGWHTGWVISPSLDEAPHPEDWFGAAVSAYLVVAVFILAFYFRTHREAGAIVYGGLLDHSWRNALTLGFLCLFLGVFWLLLLLWAKLFDVIGIEFFDELFWEPEFVYPVSGLVGGWGLGLIRGRSGLIATVRHMCEVLIRALLPLAAFILVIFLAALPFTGVAPLWDTGYAASLLLWIAAVLLFFFNAVIAAEDEAEPLNVWLLRLVLGALVLLPIDVILAGWALWLRVDQYGWSLDRLWAAFVEAFLAAYSIGYAVVLLWCRGLDAGAVRRWNTILGATLALALIIVNTPLADFRKIAAHDQAARLLAGTTPPAAFDASYLRYHLGRYGIETLRSLQESELVAGDAALEARIDAVLAGEQRIVETARDDVASLRTRFAATPGTELTDELLLRLGEDALQLGFCFHGDSLCLVGALESNGSRYLVVLRTQPYLWGAALRSGDGTWMPVGRVELLGCESGAAASPDPQQPLLRIESEFFVFRSGPCLFHVVPHYDAVK